MKRLMFAVVIVLVTFVCALSAVAQEKPAPAKPPAVSDTVKLQLENAALKQQLALVTAQLQICQSKLAPESYRDASAAIQAEIAKVITEFEKANPGWTLDASTMQPKKKGGD